MKEVPILYEQKRQCNGCSACFSVCPSQAVEMKEDEEGFFYPVINNEKCIKCYKCVRICPTKKQQSKVENNHSVGIATLYYQNYNYGGIAQAYALYKVLERMGVNAELLSYKRSQQNIKVKSSIWDKIKRNTLSGIWKRYVMKGKRWVEHRLGKRCEKRLLKRSQLLDIFREKIPHTEVLMKEQALEYIHKYNVLISGSDQIWRPGIVDEVFVFKGAEGYPGKNIISYASSVGVENFPESYLKFMKTELKKYNKISVRESITAKTFSELFGYPVCGVVDPTLLLDKKDWEKVTADRLVEEPYVFCYFLGNSRKQRKMAEKMAKMQGKLLVTLPHIQGGNKFAFRIEDWKFGEKQMYEAGMEEFFSLIKYADCVITDSFHATVFSIVFETPFWVMEKAVNTERDKTHSRIYELMNISGLEERIWSEASLLKRVPIDYNRVKMRLKPHIDFSEKYLQDALKKV